MRIHDLARLLEGSVCLSLMSLAYYFHLQESLFRGTASARCDGSKDSTHLWVAIQLHFSAGMTSSPILLGDGTEPKPAGNPSGTLCLGAVHL